jgi:hypothetical protein
MKLFVAVVMFAFVPLVGDWQEVKDWKPLFLKGSVKYASGADVTEPQGQSQQHRQGTDYIAPLLNDHPQSSPPKSGADQPDDEEKKQSLNIQRWVMRFTGGLLVVGFLQVVLIVLQACYMQQGLEVTGQSAKAAQDSADAAKRSVEIAERSMKIANRAYLAIRWPESEAIMYANDEGKKVISGARNKVLKNQIFEARCSIINVGPTPARLLTHDLFFHLCENLVVFDKPGYNYNAQYENEK